MIESPGERRSLPFPELVREVHDAYYASIFRYLDRLSGDPDLAADIAQEAFVRLFRRGFLPEKPDRWLVTVALNLFRNERSTARRRARLTARHAGDLRPASGPSPAERFEALRLQAKVRDALDRLPSRERELLLLRAEGYSYRDLAKVLELNETSVGTLLARAKRAFEDAYEEAEHAP
ncbi:MAG TPA: sigma-70 family RNA polymerase sigma factor [Gemmatimonadota bacterium]|nr:sigma-70 family RNA polymerase sigma factor [Gemmatimonadota bacterium]